MADPGNRLSVSAIAKTITNIIARKPAGTEDPLSDETIEIDGANRPFTDLLLEGLVGRWNVTGKIAGQSIKHLCEADRVLND